MLNDQGRGEERVRRAVALYWDFSLPGETPAVFFRRALLATHPDKVQQQPTAFSLPSVQSILEARQMWRGHSHCFTQDPPPWRRLRSSVAAPSSTATVVGPHRRSSCTSALLLFALAVAQMIVVCAEPLAACLVAVVLEAALAPLSAGTTSTTTTTPWRPTACRRARADSPQSRSFAAKTKESSDGPQQWH